MAVPTIPTSYTPFDGIVPFAAKGDNASIWDASDAPGSALDADFQAGSIIDTGVCTGLACTFLYDAHGSGTANQCDFFFLVSNQATVPAIGTDIWGVLPHADVSPTAAVQDDSMPAGVDVTVTPEWGRIVTRPGYFRMEPSDNVTDKYRLALVANVRYWKYIVLLAKEHGDTTNAGTLVVHGALGV